MREFTRSVCRAAHELWQVREAAGAGLSGRSSWVLASISQR